MRTKLNIQMRKDANRTLAYFLESSGYEWISVREALKWLAPELNIDPSGKKRSQVAEECQAAITALGVSVPKKYIAPWCKK